MKQNHSSKQLPFYKNKKNIIAISIFVLFSALILIISGFFDWDISQLLAKPWLNTSTKHSTNFFGNFIEIIGCLPMSVMLNISLMILSLYIFKTAQTKFIKFCFPILLLLFSLTILTYEIYYEVLSTFADILSLGITQNTSNTVVIVLISLLLSFLIMSLTFLICKKISNLEKLLLWSLMVVLVIFLSYFTIGFIKNCFPRERYRNIIYDGGNKDNFKSWYDLNWDPIKNISEGKYKSTPSAHTGYAASIYGFMFLKINKRKTKIILNTSLVLAVGCVGLGRIMSGAHYLSDVFFGGTITYLWYCVTFNLFKIKKLNIRLCSFFARQQIWKAILIIIPLLIILFIGLQFQIC